MRIKLFDRFVRNCIALCNIVGKHFAHARLDRSAPSQKKRQAWGPYRNVPETFSGPLKCFFKNQTPSFHRRVLQLDYGHHKGVCGAIEVTTNT